MLAFYALLGLELVQRMGPPFAMVRKEDLTIWVSGPKTSARQPMPDGREPVPGGCNRLVIEVPYIEATVAALSAAGVTFRNEPFKGIGGTQVLVEDPSGNPIEIFQPA